MFVRPQNKKMIARNSPRHVGESFRLPRKNIKSRCFCNGRKSRKPTVQKGFYQYRTVHLCRFRTQKKPSVYVPLSREPKRLPYRMYSFGLLKNRNCTHPLFPVAPACVCCRQENQHFVENLTLQSAAHCCKIRKSKRGEMKQWKKKTTANSSKPCRSPQAC